MDGERGGWLGMHRIVKLSTGLHLLGSFWKGSTNPVRSEGRQKNIVHVCVCDIVRCLVSIMISVQPSFENEHYNRHE